MTMVALRSLAVVWAACVGLAGCQDGNGGTGPNSGQIGGVSESEPCDEQRREAIGENDTSPLGFTAAEVLSSVSGARSAALVWAKGGSTTVTLAVGAPTAVFYVVSTPAADSDLSALSEVCRDHLEIEAPVDFSTADGAFAESLAVSLHAIERGAGSFSQELDLAALHGSYQVTEVDPSQFKEVNVYLHVDLDGDGVAGAIDGGAETFPSGTGPDAAVGVQLFDVATF